MTKRRPHPYALPIEKRKRLSKKRRAELFLLRKGRCHSCRRKIEAGERWIAEHYVSLECGGTNEFPANWDLTCRDCFHPKNKADRKKASKGRRLREREAEHRATMAARLIPVDVRGALADTPEPKGKRKWPSRPFPGSKKDRAMRAARRPQCAS